MLWSKKARGDSIIVAAVLCIVALLFVCFFHADGNAEGGGESVRIRTDHGEETLSLKENGIYTLESNGITLTLEIRDGDLFVAESTCPDQICRHMKPVGKNGGSIVCLPALVEITAEGGDRCETKPDAIAY